MKLEMEEPEYAPEQLAMKFDRSGWDAGQQAVSGMLLRSQYTWKTSRPVPYVSFVLSDHAAVVTVMARSSSSSDTWMVPSVAVESLWVGIHSLSRSLALQWGRSEEGEGVREGW